MQNQNDAPVSLRSRLTVSLARARGQTIDTDIAPWRRRLASQEPVALNLRASAEHCRRHLGLDPFEYQLIAALAMHDGWLAQMQTGEGKTLAAALAVIPHALAGRKVHIMTANDYLAGRDARWMAPLYQAWGLKVAAISSVSSSGERRLAYKADVLYLTAREAGFDFLRDGLAGCAADLVQRELDFALVDEADFILIDEARIPMVIAGDDPDPLPDLKRIQVAADQLQPGSELQVDPQGRKISLTLAGQERAAQLLELEGLHNVTEEAAWARLHAALHARHLVRRDIDYIIRDGRIELIDEFTGRVAERRRLPWGVQAALEQREGLVIQPEGRVYASIATRHFIQQYKNLAAMTATAWPQIADFQANYGLATLIVPPHRHSIRRDLPDRVFATALAKRQAITEEIRREHQNRRPILVGTATIRESEELAADLRGLGIDCVVLNASHDQEEADLIARAGRLGAVTIATNMAGRGTDIALDPAHRPELVELGGLYVLGTNRHESRRIDDQLRGRAGRQGDPGQTGYCISLDDPLFVRYGMRSFLPANVAMDDPRILAEIDRAQRIITQQNADIRAALHRYTILVEFDRRLVLDSRRAALTRGELPPDLAVLHQDLAAPPVLVQIFLARLDRFWSDQLARIEDIREGIALVRWGGRDPWLEFNRHVGESFERGWQDLLDAVSSDWTALPPARQAWDQAAALADPAGVGIHRPSSTWTYLTREDAGPEFSLSMLGAANNGIGALAALPLLLLKPLADLASRLRAWLRNR